MSDTITNTSETTTSSTGEDIVAELKKTQTPEQILLKSVADRDVKKNREQALKEAQAITERFGSPPLPPEGALKFIGGLSMPIETQQPILEQNINPISESESVKEQRVNIADSANAEQAVASQQVETDTRAKEFPTESEVIIKLVNTKVFPTQQLQDLLKEFSDLTLQDDWVNFPPEEQSKYTMMMSAMSNELIARNITSEDVQKLDVREQEIPIPSEPSHIDVSPQHATTPEASPSTMVSVEYFFNQSRTLEQNLQRGMRGFALSEDEIIKEAQRRTQTEGKEVPIKEVAAELDNLYADSLGMNYVVSELLLWEKKQEETGETINPALRTAERNRLLQIALQEKKEEDVSLFQAKEGYKHQKEWFVGLLRARVEKKNGLHDYADARKEKLQKTTSNLLELSPNSSEVAKIRASLEKGEKEMGDLLKGELGINPWWLIFLKMVVDSINLTVTMGEGAKIGQILAK